MLPASWLNSGPAAAITLVGETELQRLNPDGASDPDWPRVLKGSVTFADEGARTLLVFTWEPHDASAAENACFSAAMSGPQQGWVSGFDKLEQVLAEIAP